MKIQVYNLENKSVGEAEIPSRVFEAPWRPALVHQVITAFLANKRHPWAHTKGRGEVRGGGKKPWRQKGTGRARHGSIRSPLWRKGGKSHGPTAERTYEEKVNKKMKRQALFSVLSKKLKDGQVKVFETLEVAEPKTKLAAKMLYPLADKKPSVKKLDLLMVPSLAAKRIFRAAANLPKTKVVHPGSLNAYDAMNYRDIFIEKEALGAIEKHFSASNS